MSLEAFRLCELVQVCTELGIELGQIKRKPHIIELLQAEDVSVEEFTEALGEIRGREQEVRGREQEAREREREERENKKRAEEEERKRRADEEAHERARKNLEWALQCERWELEKREYKREMERLDYEFEQLELAKKTREFESLRRATTGVEGVTGKACQGKEKVGAGVTEITENQRLSPDTTVAVLRKPDPNSERRDGESDVEAATESVCQEKKKTEAGDTEVTGNQRVSSDATDAVPRKTDAVPHKTDPTPERRENGENALLASSGGFPKDEGDTRTETTPGKPIQLMESGAEMQEIAVQESSQNPDRSDRHPCGLRTKLMAPSQESERPTRREVMDISFDEINESCLVRLQSPDSRPFTESRRKEDDDEYASRSESSSMLEDGRPQASHPREPATGGGCAGKGPTGDTMEPGRDKAGPTSVHPGRSSCSWHGASETENSEAVTSQRPRPMRKRQRRISVVRSGSTAACKQRPGKRDECPFKKKKRSSWLGGGKLQDPHPNEPRTHSSSSSKEPGGGNNEPGTTQRGSKRRQSSSPVVQPGIPSDGETKGDLRDCSFAPPRKSKEKNLNSSSEAKDKLGVG